jgi:hypothetical protein
MANTGYPVLAHAKDNYSTLEIRNAPTTGTNPKDERLTQVKLTNKITDCQAKALRDKIQNIMCRKSKTPVEMHEKRHWATNQPFA